MRSFLIALACFAVLGCEDIDIPDIDGPVPMTQVFRQKTSGIMARRGEVITRESRWVQVWDEITSRQSPKPPIPTIDWNTHLLVLAAGGETGDACKDLEIEKVERNDGALVVSVLDKSPGTNCNTCPPITIQPVHVVSVVRAATSATFDWKAVTVNCP